VSAGNGGGVGERERIVPELAWFEGGPLDRKRLTLAGPGLPLSLTAWKHRDSPSIVEIGAGAYASERSWHGDRQRDLWEPHRYGRGHVDDLTFSWTGQHEPEAAA
jgi:hypothetical protein